MKWCGYQGVAPEYGGGPMPKMRGPKWPMVKVRGAPKRGKALLADLAGKRVPSSIMVGLPSTA